MKMTYEQIGEVVMALGKKPLECDDGILGWHDSVHKERYDLLALLTDITDGDYEFRVKPDEPTPEQIPGYRVVDFRPPLKGEKFWTKCRHGNGALSNCTDENDPPKEPRYILAKIEPGKPETREVLYPVEVLGEMYVIRRAGQTRNITKLPGMVGFKRFEYSDGGTGDTATRDRGTVTEVAEVAVFEETPCK